MKAVICEGATAGDFLMSSQLIKAAFTNDESDGMYESRLVGELRAERTYRPAWDIVARLPENGQLVGQAFLSEIKLSRNAKNLTCVCLAPLSVAPAYQGQGIGKQLLAAVDAQVKKDDVVLVSVLGDPNYYGKFGYVPALDHSIAPEFEVPSAYYLVKLTEPNKHLAASGTVTYRPAFNL